MVNDPHFKEFLRLLKEKKVEFIVVGGFAVIYHGYVRYTGDLDLWVKRTSQNQKRLISAINQFGYDTEPLTELDFEAEIIAFHLDKPPKKIDISNQISGVKFEDCMESAEKLKIDEFEIAVLNLVDLIKNKKASGRLKDLLDIQNLTDPDKE